jgi:hypothetical protein
MAFSNVIKAHEERKQALLAQVERAEADAQASVIRLSSHLIDHLNDGVATIYANQQRLDEESKKLQGNAARFSKTTERYVAVFDLTKWFSCHFCISTRCS